MTRQDLIASGYKLHHSARCRDYVSRRADENALPAVPYAGKFGHGYTVKVCAYDSTNYCWIEYWIK